MFCIRFTSATLNVRTGPNSVRTYWNQPLMFINVIKLYQYYEVVPNLGFEAFWPAAKKTSLYNYFNVHFWYEIWRAKTHSRQRKRFAIKELNFFYFFPIFFRAMFTFD